MPFSINHLVNMCWILFRRADIFFFFFSNGFPPLLYFLFFCLRAHEVLIDGWGDTHQQVSLIHVVAWCLDDVITRFTSYKLQKLLPWRSFFFFFFPVVKCGQRLKQRNECVNLHKGKERHSILLERCCICMSSFVCVCVQKCMCGFVTWTAFSPPVPHTHTHPFPSWQSTASCVMSALCYAVLTHAVCWLERNGCYLQYVLLGCQNSKGTSKVCVL